MVLISALLMIVVSLMTKKPARTTLARYFGDKQLKQLAVTRDKRITKNTGHN